MELLQRDLGLALQFLYNTVLQPTTDIWQDRISTEISLSELTTVRKLVVFIHDRTERYRLRARCLAICRFPLRFAIILIIVWGGKKVKIGKFEEIRGNWGIRILE